MKENEKEILKEIINQLGTSPELLANIKQEAVLLTIIEINNDLFKYINNDFKSNKKFILKAMELVKNKEFLFDELSESLQQDKDIIAKINEHHSNEKEEKKISNKEMIEGFLRNPLTPDEYCLANDIKKQEFNRVLQIISKDMPELHKKYEEKMEKLTEILTQLVRTAVVYMQNGIETDGTIREFDIIDYCNLTTVNLKEAYKIAKNHLTSEERKTIGKFLSKNISEETVKRKVLMDMKHIITDEDQNQFEISKEIKSEIFDYLESINCPLSNKSYKIGLKRYLNGTLKEAQNSKTR